MAHDALLRLRGVSKRFGALRALTRVDADFQEGEVHAVLGENGAGKSTLMNVIYGLVRPDEGAIHLNGENVRFDRPGAARLAGIGMVHQEFALVQALSVAENLALALSRPGSLRCDTAGVAVAAGRLAEEIGLDIGDPAIPVGKLSVGARQRVEILKALAGDTRVLILDEPTAVLTPEETEQLFRVLDGLRKRGVAVLFITHKLREVMTIADRVTVLRRGAVVGTWSRTEVDEASLAALMIGQMLTPKREARRCNEIGRPPRLRVTALTVRGEGPIPMLREADLKIHAGEVLGIAGVDGNGQSELFEVLVGLRVPDGGTIHVDEQALTRFAPPAAIAAGIGHIPPDRQLQGLILQASVCDNLALNSNLLRQLARGPFLHPGAVRAVAERLIERHVIQVEDPNALAATLSGGNQQRLIVARALALDPSVLVAFNPGRGLDVAAARAVSDAIEEALTRGVAVLLISTDLDEILELSDCVAVLYHGQLSEPMRRPFSVERLGSMMTGVGSCPP